MTTYSELLQEQSRGKNIKPKHNNRVTSKRKNLGRKIIQRANGDPQAEYNDSMSILGDNVNRLQEYIIQHSEEPAPDLNDMVKQVMYLRRTEAKEASEVLDFNGEDAKVFLEQQESEFYDDNGYEMDGFLGDLGAPLEIANAHIESGAAADGFAATGIIGSIVGIVGTKLNSSELKRAAQGKGANFLTGLSTGGKAHFNSLVAYFRAHPDIKAKVLNGEITDEGQLPGWTVPTQSDAGVRQGVNDLARPYVDDQVKRYIPMIIIGVVLLIIIVIFIARRKK